MPNTQRVDFVPPHKHSADDVAGYGPYLFPPTQIALGAAADPTRTLSTYALLTDMDLDGITLGSQFPMWEVRVTFTGQFQHTNAGAQVGIRLMRGSLTTITNTTRVGTVVSAGGLIVMSTSATFILSSSESTAVQLHWANVGGAGTATASGTSRRLEYVVRPYSPVITP